MTNQNYIRKAVELADGWIAYDNSFLGGCYFAPHSYDRVPQPVLDALAAQLVRQVDALPFEQEGKTYFEVNNIRAHLCTDITETEAEGSDRTMNTIKSIVDSKVLE